MRVFVLGVLAALLLAGCASHATSAGTSTSQPAPPATVVRTFTAYQADGQLAVTVHDVARGSCWTASIAAPGAHAYRCFAGDDILDPCFAPPHRTTGVTQVACLAAPWAQAQILQLTEALPHITPVSRAARPWAFTLSTGVQCVAITGMVPQIDGVDVGYHCTDGSAAALRDPKARQVIARVGAAGTGATAAGPLRDVAVDTIWRG